MLFAGAIYVGTISPAFALGTVLWCFTACVVLISTLRIYGSLHALLRRARPASQDSQPETDTDWPVYTVLVPLHREAHMVERLMDGLEQLDYPMDCLQVLIITEASDAPTVNEVNHCLRPPFHNIVVPYSLPQTKPKALNIAMQYARGQLVTIYDAEDRPHSGQLKTAAKALMSDQQLGAVQAPLTYFNAPQNWLTAQFALEYAALFYVWNPIIARLGLPFPLGGTSNHIKRTALDAVNYWDSYNVTEDADLSFRLAAYGWSIGIIEPPTDEEAVSKRGNWQYQRERWLKGFLQSWIVHMRRLRGLGIGRAIALQLTLGFTLLSAYLHLPCFILMSTLWGLCHFDIITYVPEPLFWYVMVYGYAGALFSASVGICLAGRARLMPHIITMPFYWLLLFWPALKAAYQLLTAPYVWNKTRHGDAVPEPQPAALP